MKQFLNILALIILFCCFNSIAAFACGEGCNSESIEKKSSCCKSEDKVGTEKSCCSIKKETSGNKSHSCDEGCEHSSCPCSPVSFQLIIESTIVELRSFDYFEAKENHVFPVAEANISDGFTDNWLFPKIG